MDETSIKEEINERDKIDSNREDSPLIIPEDGIELDTSGLTINEVVARIKECLDKYTNWRVKNI